MFSNVICVVAGVDATKLHSNPATCVCLSFSWFSCTRGFVIFLDNWLATRLVGGGIGPKC